MPLFDILCSGRVCSTGGESLRAIQGSWYAELMLPLLFICVTRGKIKTERSLRAELYLASFVSVLWRNLSFILGRFLRHLHKSVCPICWQLVKIYFPVGMGINTHLILILKLSTHLILIWFNYCPFSLCSREISLSVIILETCLTLCISY